jgi:hypothetical protein
MKIQTETLLSEAIDLVDGIDHVLANTMTQYDLSASNCYDLAERLERARNILLTVGDRMYNQERKSQTLDIIQGVPF